MSVDSPQIKIKEIHSVRWFSFYNALDSLYRSWQPLAIQFEQGVSKSLDPKAKGFLKTMATAQFLIVTNVLMDVIPVVTHLNLVFQKENLDLSAVGPAVQGVKAQLERLKSEPGYHESKILAELGAKASHYMDVKITDTEQQRSAARSVKAGFIDNLMAALDLHFPADARDMVNNLSVLGLRGLRFMSAENLKEYGNEKLKVVRSILTRVPHRLNGLLRNS